MRFTSYKHLLWIIALLGIACIAAPAQAPPEATQAQSSVVRVTSPRPQQQQTDNFVTVRYELQNPTSAPAGSPNFQVQMDGNDPVTTASTEQSFTGLTPGQHVITVRLVDANGTSVPDSQTQVAIFVVPTAQNGGTSGTQSPAGSGTQTTSPTPQAMNTDPTLPGARVETAGILPDSGSLLPVAGLVGFSFLLGGIVCGAWKTRP